MRITYHTDPNLKNKIIYEDGKRLSYFAEIDAIRVYRSHALIIANDITHPEDLSDNTQINIYNEHLPQYYKHCTRAINLNRTKTGYTTSQPTDKDFVNHIIFEQGITIVSGEEDAHYTRLARFADILGYLYEKKPIYKQIVNEGELVPISDIILMSEDKDKYINQILFSVGNLRQLTEVVERVLAEFNTETRYNPITQEEQVSMFLELTKKNANDVEELVPDTFIERMKEHDAYKFITTQLENNGFKLSETQQFNSLQHAGLLLNSDEPILYNLSDMGAGKTLMTVESIMLAQLVLITETSKKLSEIDTSNINSIALPAINVIAPTLSLKSSWLKTFNLFVATEKVNDAQYTYNVEHDGHIFHGKINFAGFTVKGGSVHVDNLIPLNTADRDYLIIDEIHQLVSRNIKADKFIDKEKGTSVIIRADYKTFVLSGTLANLTTKEWYNMIQFLGLGNVHWGTTLCTPKELSNGVTSLQRELYDDMVKMSDNLLVDQNREFDPSFVSSELQNHEQRKISNKEHYFNLKYGASILNIQNYGNNDLAHILHNKRYGIISDSSVLSTPNFELFYKLVSNTVVTAQSIQIAEELFGEQAEQHKSQVIKTKSPLTSNDIDLLKRLHKIVADVDVYKSQMIATNIANAILNLNDGLQTKTIYDVLNTAANKSVNFLSYLTKMDLTLLEDISSSNLIQTPKLEETEKFKIVQDILEKEKDETFLIVVNNPEVAIKLSNALDIAHLTTKQMKNELDYQDVIDELYTKQNIVVVPQHMIKSSLDLVQANRLIQYQLNTEVSDIIQTQNRINRIGQTRETKAYYIATDILQENIIELFLETYRNIKVAHKGIVELFVDMEQQIDVVSDYLANALDSTVAQDSVIPEEYFFVVNGGQISFQPEWDEFPQGQVLWYQNKLLTKNSDGETIVIGTTEIGTTQPNIVTLERG